MPEADVARERLRFGVFEADPQAGELTRRGRRVGLQEQPFRLLVLLLHRPGELVTRDELRSRLWPDTTVDFDHGLNKAVSKLRSALADSAQSPRFIETVARRGYRFIGDVATVEAAAESPAATSGAAGAARPPFAGVRAFPRRPALAWVLAGAAAAAVAVAVTWQVRPAPPADETIRSLAVLPLANFSPDRTQDYFADGMTDELTTRLGQFSNLRVTSRTSAMVYKGARQRLPEIARALNVDAVVEGSVVRSGDKVRINVELIRGANDRRLWGRSYDGEVRDTLALQDGVARDIAEQVRATLDLQAQAALQTSEAIDPAAFDDYLKGRYFLDKRTGDGLKTAITYFSRATETAPDFAEAYAGLAECYALSGDWEYGVMPPGVAFARAKAAATRALALNESLGEAHTALAFALDLYAWDWKTAEKEYLRALQLSPSSATAHLWYGWHLIETGRTDKGLGELRFAESLDPLSPIIGAELADGLDVDHRYADSVRQSQKTLEIDPNFAIAHSELGQAYTQERGYDQAIAEFKREISLDGHNGVFDSDLAYADALSGRPADAKRILAELQGRAAATPSIDANIALIYVGLGDHDAAMAWLDRAYAAHFNPSILMRPAWDPLRFDIRFKDLLRRVGLPG